jgi:hypothetical protein
MRQRTKKVETRLRWQKRPNSGSMWLGKRIIKPGEIFLAFRHQIPVAFMDSIICLEEEKLAEEKAADNGVIEPRILFELHHRGGGFYDVVNIETREPMNDKALRKEEADELLNALNGSESDLDSA